MPTSISPHPLAHLFIAKEHTRDTRDRGGIRSCYHRSMELIRSSQGHLSVPSSNYPSRHKRSISQTPRKHLACHTFEKSVHGQSHNTFPSRDQRLVQPENPKSQPNASVKEVQGIHQVAQALTQQVPSNESSVECCSGCHRFKE